MGAFRHPLTLLSADGSRAETVEALVDTGATYTQLPWGLLDRMGWRTDRTRPFEYADGRRVQLPMGEVRLQMDGEQATMLCIFAEEGSPILLGVFTLEAFGLAVDTVNQRLTKAPGLLMGIPLMCSGAHEHLPPRADGPLGRRRSERDHRGPGGPLKCFMRSLKLGSKNGPLPRLSY